MIIMGSRRIYDLQENNIITTQPVREKNYCMVLRPFTSSDGDKLNNSLCSNIPLCTGIHKTLVNFQISGLYLAGFATAYLW